MVGWLVAAGLAQVPDLLEAGPPGTPAPDDVAVVIGLEHYGFLPDVPYAHRDALAVRSWLLSSGGLAPERVQLLRSGDRAQILAAIEAADAEVGPRGRLWLWFSGHGATLPPCPPCPPCTICPMRRARARSAP